MIDMRPVLLVVGVLLATLGCAMMLPAIHELATGEEEWPVFAGSAVLTLFVGTGLAFANQGRTTHFSIKQAFLMINLAWLSLTAFGALPLYWSRLDLTYTDAFFEAMSGITTTGSTVIVGLDAAPAGLLLWRAMLQWLGGLGIVVMAMSVLPILQVGGMQLFKVEAFDMTGKVLPRATQIAGYLCLLYVAYTFLCAVAYSAAGMTGFDAAVHSMTTIATGGYSSHDASFAYFDSAAVEIVAIVGMMAGSIHFVLYLYALSGNPRRLTGDSQVRWFFGTVAIFIALAWMARELGAVVQHPDMRGLVTVAFNIVSILTGTGYASTAFDAWGPMAMTVFFIAMFIGGCSGSTTCGIKIFRFQIIIEMLRVRVLRMIDPGGVFVERFNRKPVPEQVTNAVLAFFFLYLLVFGIGAFLLGLTGLDTLTALSSSATAISNVGPGLGPTVGPEGNFASLPDVAKWIMCVQMLLGRLELFTVLVLILPSFWRS